MVKTRSPTQYVQYSKKMATCISLFWAAYRLLALVVTFFRPQVAESMEAISKGVDDVMICNVAFYCGNSVAEKGIVSYFGSKTTSTDNEPISNG